MDPSNTEVRLFLQHLAKWLGAFSQRHVSECHAAIDQMSARGRHLCADPEFRRLFEAQMGAPDCPDPERALGGLCSFLSALTTTDPFTQYRS